MFSSVSHPATLQNLVTKDLATEVIQESLLSAKVHGQQEVNVVFDRYRDETIKGTTRTRRSKTARPIRRLV